MQTSLDEDGVGAYRYKHYYPLAWLLIVSFTFVALVVIWDIGLIFSLLILDRSYLTSVIFILFLLSSCHAGWHIVSYSNLFERLRLRDHKLIMGSKITHSNSSQSHANLEVTAANLRSPGELGWFLVDLALRLGLVGTIIGFILIFTSLSDISIDGSNGLRDLMIAMSGGMGTALLTTLCGLIAATIMSFQYLVLGRQTEQLLALILLPSSNTSSEGE